MSEALELLKQLVMLPSVNPSCAPANPELTGELRVAEFIETWAKVNGFEPKRVEAAPGRFSLLFELPAAQGLVEPPVIACFAHMDTVWVPAMEKPFELKEKDGKLYGLGASDDKGPLVSCLMALKMLKAAGNLPCRFVLGLTCDEEAGFTGITSLVPNAVKPSAAIVCEGTKLDLVTAHKGTIRWKITTPGRAVHASLVPEGENAIYRAAKLVSLIEKYSKDLVHRSQHKLLGFPTISVGTISGGTQPNSVPDHCEFVIDRRLLPKEMLGDAEQELMDVLDAACVPYEISSPLLFSPAFEISMESTFAQSALAEARKVNTGTNFRGLSCSTEAGQVGTFFKVPTLVFGPGDVLSAHAPGEVLDPAQLDKASEIIKNIVLNAKF